MQMHKLAFRTRLLLKLGRYAHEVQRSREELAESTQEHALPPIPPGNRHKRTRRTS